MVSLGVLNRSWLYGSAGNGQYGKGLRLNSRLLIVMDRNSEPISLESMQTLIVSSTDQEAILLFSIHLTPTSLIYYCWSMFPQSTPSFLGPP